MRKDKAAFARPVCGTLIPRHGLGPGDDARPAHAPVEIEQHTNADRVGLPQTERTGAATVLGEPVVLICSGVVSSRWIVAVIRHIEARGIAGDRDEVSGIDQEHRVGRNVVAHESPDNRAACRWSVPP